MSQPALPSGVGVTAIVIAKERSVESARPDRLFQDTLATDFVDAAKRALGPGGPNFDVTLGDYLPLMRGYVALRTRYFDERLLAACAAGCRQVVSLAAGLDARAWRLPWPSGVRFFELDVPEMLAFKRQVVAARGATPPCERHEVGVDLREDWPAALRGAGFEPQVPTAWLAEGLLIYLSDADNERLLENVGRLSAPGSWLALEHADSRVLKQPGVARRRAESLDAHGVVWQSGIDAPGDWLRRQGWSATVLDPDAYARSIGRPLPPVLDASAETGRIWLASGTR